MNDEAQCLLKINPGFLSALGSGQLNIDIFKKKLLYWSI